MKQKPTIHLSLQAKGGVSKSFIAALILEYVGEKKSTLGIDTDGSNRTLAEHKSLDVMSLALIQNNKINESKFDDMVEYILGLENQDVVIDIGSSTFQPFVHYMLENKIIPLHFNKKFNVMLHLPIVGGEAQADTISGLHQIVEAFKDTNCQFIVWVNKHFGNIIDDNRNEFEEMEIYTKLKKHIHGVVYLEKKGGLFTMDMEQLKKSKKLFKEVNGDPKFKLLTKSRLNIIKEDIWQKLDVVFKHLNLPKETSNEN